MCFSLSCYYHISHQLVIRQCERWEFLNCDFSITKRAYHMSDCNFLMMIMYRCNAGLYFGFFVITE